LWTPIRNCKYSIRGKYRKRQEVREVEEKKNLAPSDKFLTFEKEDHMRDWFYLQITMGRR